jgi:hypothetical protein
MTLSYIFFIRSVFFVHILNLFTMKCTSLISALLGLLFAQVAFAQSRPCMIPSNRTDSLIINTGYNHSANAAYTPVVQDPYWVLTNAPTGVTVNLNGPAFVIQNAWSPIPISSTYISAFPTAGNNQPNINSSLNPYSFERCFFVCEDNTTVFYNMTVRVDNRVTFYIGNTLLPGQPNQLTSQTTVFNFDNNDDLNNQVTGSIVLNSGMHYLRAEMRNDNSGSAMGLNIRGTLATRGKKLLKQGSGLCNSTGYITGFKFEDTNCNGIQDPGEPYLAGWQIQLNGNGVSLSATTDANGYYSFSVPPGTYTVSEVMQPGWSATTPVGGTQTGLVVTLNSINQVNFGNCPRPPSPYCCPGQNLIRNGDFEAGNTGFTSQYAYNAATTAGATRPGQYNVVTGAQALSISSGWVVQDPGTCSNTSGKFMVVNGATTGSGRRVIWEQTVPVKGRTLYKFCVMAKNLKQCDFDVLPKLYVEFSSPLNNFSRILDVNVGNCNWDLLEKNVLTNAMPSTLNIKIFLDESQPGDGNDFALDNIALIELPPCPANAVEFQLSTRHLTTATYEVTATSTTTPECDSIWWKVCEWNANTNVCIPGTQMGPLPAWETAATTFPGYTFYYGKIYKITRGSAGECNSSKEFIRYVGSSLRSGKVLIVTEEEYEKNPRAILDSLK